ncbi:type IV secretion system protein [Qipengyuania sediminis]|uniref:type IV secretion system protein n=1 Tax=Qipengyuania sediminis TaxID=1532023 RepID=UPI00105A7F19|nr:type IV secretion system protein [Qipengyuania sediminis]
MASACPTIVTGDQFLTRIITNIDCQTQLVGTLGWQALAQPGALATTLMAGLLTLFVALFGIRLLFGPTPGARDVVLKVLRIGIVLTLAFSWPAFRALIHDVVISGPGEIAAQITTPVRGEDGMGFLAQLQAADNAILRLTEAGTGRQTGAFIDREAAGGTFRGTALQDETGFGNARLIWLAGLIGAFALLRLVAGLLLALGPLAAGLLLFEPTRGLFSGWLRGLVLALIGTIGVTLVLAVELGVLLPWLTDALRVRSLGYATPAAPTELFAMTLAFTVVQFAMIAILARVAFTRGWLSIPRLASERVDAEMILPAVAAVPTMVFAESRAQRIADAMEIQLRREGYGGSERTQFRNLITREGAAGSGSQPAASGVATSQDRLGSSWRRTRSRRTAASRRRDGGR